MQNLLDIDWCIQQGGGGSNSTDSGGGSGDGRDTELDGGQAYNGTATDGGGARGEVKSSEK